MTNYTVKAKVPMEIGLDDVESEEEAKQIVEDWFHAQLSTGDENYPFDVLHTAKAVGFRLILL